MSTVSEIKEAIERLSPQEYCELMAVLHPFEDDEWDRKMQSDAAAGKFNALKEKWSGTMRRDVRLRSDS